jgi:phytanoyl-CoA hydroxylase
VSESIKVVRHGDMEAHDPCLYRYDQPVHGVATLDDVGEAQYRQFEEQGYFTVEQAFTPDEVAAAIDGLMEFVAGTKKDFELTLEGTDQEWDAAAPLDEKLRRVRKLYRFARTEPRLAQLAFHPRLMPILCRLMHAAPTLHADQALLKPAHIGSEKPWHQDTAYFNVPPDTPVIGVWIALDEATPENGCMHIIPGSHRDGPAPHFRVRDWQLCDAQIPVERDHVVPLRPGGMLVFHGLTWHGTPVNRSPLGRRALQYHYKPAETAQITSEARMAVFGGEGKDVSC